VTVSTAIVDPPRSSRPATAPPRDIATAPPHLLNGELWIEVVDVPADLDQHAAPWDDLAADAAEPNVFYERWMLQPAISAFAPAGRVRVVCVYRRGKRQDVAPALVGLFPLQTVRRGLHRATTYELWGHDYNFLRTPLIRSGHLVETLTVFFDWVEKTDRRASVVEMPLIHGEGPFAKALTQVLYERKNLTYTPEVYNRALLRRGESADAYIEQAVSSHQRQEVKRQYRRLGEQGAVETRVLNNAAQLDHWLDEFLRLEASGWKGSEGTAFAAADSSQNYFRQICRTAWDRGQLQMLGLFLSGVPIALKVNFLTGAGAYAFKIAYSEEHSKFSPGVQLELENIRAAHSLPDWRWMDSSAVPNHFMINRLWKDQRTIQHLLISTGTAAGNLLVGALPLLRAIKRTVRPIRNVKH
jgi:CelD/BcsL family acetyltransferase involved in cellulose biosynthesis